MAHTKEYCIPHFYSLKPPFSQACRFVLFFVFSTMLSQQAYPASLALAWDPADNQAEGFSLYYGQESGNYTEVIDVGDQTDYTVFGLEPDQTYYFAVTAYNTFGESDFSVELAADPPYYCEADFDMDNDVDGVDLIFAIANATAGVGLATVNAEYGHTDCL